MTRLAGCDVRQNCIPESLFCARTAVPDFSLASWRTGGEMCQNSVSRQQMSHDSDASLRGGCGEIRHNAGSRTI